jgi:hypothetical protein
MLCRVDLVRTDVSEERNTSIIRVKRIGELGTLAVTSNGSTLRRTTKLLVHANVGPSSSILFTLMMEALCSSEMAVLTRTTRRNLPEDDILHSNRRENLKYYTSVTGWTLQRRRYVSPVKYELGFYIAENGIRHSHRRVNLKS